MKIGMNMLLWATHVVEEHYPQLEKIKATGFDGVEIPIT
jgi:D-psicose/D-tagatose/L-ribulose 3-epimerase